MKNNGAFKAIKNEVRQSIIKLLQDQEAMGLPYMRQSYQGMVLDDFIELYKVTENKDKAIKALEEVDKIESLEFIARVHYDYYSEEFSGENIIECLKSDKTLYIELMEAIATALYYEEIHHREDYTIKDLITLIKEEE